MKKLFLLLTSLVFGLGQVFADDVTFSVSDLKASLPENYTNIALPYTWEGTPAPVNVTFAKEGTESIGVSTVIAFNAGYTITVAATNGATLGKITFTTNPASQIKNATASTGAFESGVWTPAEGDTPSEVTFTTTNNFRITSINVAYTPKGNVGEDPVTSYTETLTVGVGATGQIEFTMEGTPAAVAYTSSDTKIATVAANGKVTGVKVGTCTITTTIDEENGNRWLKETAVTVIQPEAVYVANAAFYTGTEPFICDYLTGDIYALNNLGNYEKWGVMGAADDLATLTTYEGKLVVLNTDNCEYKFVGGEWKNVGSVLPQEIETETNYKNMQYNEGWYCRWGYENTFNKFVYDAETGTNTVNPYEGAGGWEPYQSFTIEGLNPGDTYRLSFKYSGTAWNSWSSYTKLPFYVLNNPDFGSTLYVEEPNSEVLAVALLPNTETVDKEYALQFVADKDFCVLAVQFGVCDDGAHNPAFAFTFANLKIERIPIVEEYVNNFKLVSFDNNAYTPLAYIEATGQARENTFTLPYIPVTETQIKTKFMVYDSSGGWTGIFCARDVHAGTGISLYMNGNKTNFGYFTGGTRGAGDNFAPFSVDTDYEVEADVTKLVVNGETYETGNTVTNPTTRALSLFANPEWDNAMRGRFYYFNVAEADETIFEFIPAMRHDGVFGFYDANKKLFIQPARGSYDGYSYKKLDDQAYMTFTNETRIVIAGATAQYLPDIQNIPSAMFSWTSSDDNIATVAPDGTVTGVAAGKVTITVTATYEDWTASYELTVAEPEYKRFDTNNVGYAIVTGGDGWYAEGQYDFRVNNLCDNDASTNFGCTGIDQAWAIIIASEPVAVQQYFIVTGYDNYEYPDQNPVSWKLEGSNDNQNWTLIDEQVKSYKLQAKNQEVFDFPVNGTEKYKYFKFTATQLAGDLELGEFWINGQDHDWGSNDAYTTFVPETCTTPGGAIYECSDCHAIYSKLGEVLPHAYVNGVCTECGAKASEVTLLPTRGDNNTPYYAKFRYADGVSDAEYVDIEEGWTEPSFFDGDWDELMMPLGSFGPYHTRWVDDYNTFWFRRDFFVEDPATFTTLTLKVTHDDDCAVFLNGTMVFQEYNWTGGENDWRIIEVDPSLLVPGNNVLAMYIEQNWGGAYCDFGLFATAGATIKVTDAKYATFVAPCDLDFTGADVTANAAKFDGEFVQLTPVTTVPYGTAVVVAAEEGTYIVPKTSDANLGADNELVAAVEDVVADGTQYILAKKDGKVGFYKTTPETTIAAGKGYMVFGEAGIKGFYPIEGEGATGIGNVEFAGENAPIYNVAGQRLNKMQKGINIVGSKKVLK